MKYAEGDLWGGGWSFKRVKCPLFGGAVVAICMTSGGLHTFMAFKRISSVVIL
ncbi:hypothetical protein D3C87_815860 [compost metagenome]